jgi:hypothetical protein
MDTSTRHAAVCTRIENSSCNTFTSTLVTDNFYSGQSDGDCTLHIVDNDADNSCEMCEAPGYLTLVGDHKEVSFADHIENNDFDDLLVINEESVLAELCTNVVEQLEATYQDMEAIHREEETVYQEVGEQIANGDGRNETAVYHNLEGDRSVDFRHRRGLP